MEPDTSAATRAPLDLSSLAGIDLVRASLRSGANLVRQEPTLVLWSLLARVLRSFVGVAPFVVLMLFVLIHLGALESDSLPAVLSWAGGLVETLTSPSFIIGTSGLFFVTAIASWLVGVATDTGILGSLTRRSRAQRVAIEKGLFFKVLGERFGVLVGFGFVRGLCLVAAALLTAGLLYGSWNVLDGEGWIEAGGGVGAALTLAVCGVLGGVVAASVLILFHVASSYIMFEDKGVFEALSSAFELVTTRAGEVFSLFCLIGAWFFVAWCIYAPFYALASVMGAEPDLALVGSLVQIAADILLAIASAVGTVWAYGVVFTWAGAANGWLKHPAALPRRRAEGLPAIVPGQATGAQRAVSAVSVPEDELHALLPESTPHVFAFRDIQRAIAEDEPS